jgi:hypothetical protein
MTNFNPWVVQAPEPFEAQPIGFWLADYQGVEDKTLRQGDIKWRFSLKVKSGEHVGKTISALTDRKLNPNTLSGRLISGLLGRELKEGENVKEALDACKGKTYMVSVDVGPQGGKPGVKSIGKPPAM